MKFIFALLLTILTGCYYPITPLDKEQIMAYQIMGRFSDNIEEEAGLHFLGTGLGENKENRKLNYLSVTFAVDRVLTLEEGRKLGVEVLSAFLNSINSREDFKEALTEYPFTPKYTKVILIGITPETKDADFIESVIAGDTIYYYSDDIRQPKMGLLHKESFEEAVCILKQQGLL